MLFQLEFTLDFQRWRSCPWLAALSRTQFLGQKQDWMLKSQHLCALCPVIFWNSWEKKKKKKLDIFTETLGVEINNNRTKWNLVLILATQVINLRNSCHSQRNYFSQQISCDSIHLSLPLWSLSYLNKAWHSDTTLLHFSILSGSLHFTWG